MTTNESIAFTLGTSQFLVRWFVEDLSRQEYLHRAAATGNCAAWILGHLTLADRRTLARLGVGDLPPLPDGFERRFAREDGAPAASEFGDVAVLLPLFDRHRSMLVEKARQIPADQLDRPVDLPHPRFKTTGEMLSFMALHTTMHAGQISMIRRSLGRQPLI